MRSSFIFVVGVCSLVLWMGSGCGKGTTQYRAIVQISGSADCIGTNKIQFGSLEPTDAELTKQVEEFKLADKWSTPGRSVSKEEAVQRLKSSIQLGADKRWITLRLIGSDPAECEALAKSLATAIKSKAEQTASREIAALVESRQKELDALQEKLSVTRKELVGMQKGSFVPSQFRLTPEYEAAARDKIKAAQVEETERAGQLESIRKMQGEELRSALVKVEMARIAAASSSTNAAVNTLSSLLSANQAQKSAEKELEMAKSGAINETNAVGHAELRLEQANRNLTNTMDAYVKSLEIESDVARARREEMEKQLEKLQAANKQSGERAVVEKEIERLNAQLTVLASDIEQWKLCQRMLPDAIQVGEAQVEPVQSR